ncbi:MAG TPA: DUF4276 family protein [Planctomycetaceae bacterium]|nr:DUF4276 family protein [Planctomycetaceae bacterium]HQZ68249.1 DUF4276 family protein [Planctomycetaceae bacterium]
MKRIVLFVEGEGEAEAAPAIVSRIITDLNGWDAVTIDPHPFRVGHVSKLTRDGYSEWRKKLLACMKRKDVSGVLLLLDGDAESINGKKFCAKDCALELAENAGEVGGGQVFSVACDFACQEFESWFIGGISGYESIPDGRTIHLPTQIPPNPELAPRDAKGWLRKVVSGGYKPTRDQLTLAQALNLSVLRTANLRSFVRMEHAVAELIEASRTGTHILTPSKPEN